MRSKRSRFDLGHEEKQALNLFSSSFQNLLGNNVKFRNGLGEILADEKVFPWGSEVQEALQTLRGCRI